MKSDSVHRIVSSLENENKKLLRLVCSPEFGSSSSTATSLPT